MPACITYPTQPHPPTSGCSTPLPSQATLPTTTFFSPLQHLCFIELDGAFHTRSVVPVLFVNYLKQCLHLPSQVWYEYSFRILLSDSSEGERERLARVARTEELEERGCGDCVRCTVCTVTTFGDLRSVL